MEWRRLKREKKVYAEREIDADFCFIYPARYSDSKITVRYGYTVEQVGQFISRELTSLTHPYSYLRVCVHSASRFLRVQTFFFLIYEID